MASAPIPGPPEGGGRSGASDHPLSARRACIGDRHRSIVAARLLARAPILAAIVSAAVALGAPKASSAGTCEQETLECAGDLNGDHRVSVDELVAAVGNALSGCPDSEPRGLSLSVRVERPEGGAGVRVVAEVRNEGDSPVAYLYGCSALCHPTFYERIYLTVIGPYGDEVPVRNPCLGPLLCGQTFMELAPGDHLEQQLSIAGTRWEQEGEISIVYCGACTERDFDPGLYTVVARFRYSEDLAHPGSSTEQIVALTQFTWP